MYQDWQSEINRLLLLLGIAVITGLLLGNWLLIFLCALIIYLAHSFYQLNRLRKWLRSLATDLNISPPESSGIWGLLFDGIYRLQRGQRSANEELQHILTRAQNSVAALDFGVVLIDKTSNLEWWNSAAQSFLGLRYPEDRLQLATNLIRDPRFSDYYYKEIYQEPLRISSPKNPHNILEFQITKIGEYEKLLVVRDITQLHRLEQMRTDFVGNISHELRTPITVISGYLETLVDSLDAIDKVWHTPLIQMLQQSKRMENIVRDLLILSQLETAAVSIEQTKVNINKLLSEIVHDTSIIFEDKRHSISMKCDHNLFIKGDQGELYSAFSNLVFNAAKYTPSEGVVQLKCKIKNDKIVVSVVDNGIGIEQKHIPRLTERFYRVDDSRSTNTGGTGLGLAIVKHILMRHDAVLEISSRPGKGSIFKCIFPISY